MGTFIAIIAVALGTAGAFIAIVAVALAITALDLVGCKVMDIIESRAAKSQP